VTTDKSIQKLVDAALAIEAEEAIEAGQLGFMCRAMAQATMPHKKTDEYSHVRVNGNFRLSMLAAPEIGLPYGSIPRLVLAWLTTEAARTKQRDIELGDSLSAFLRELELAPSGGKRGYMPRVKNQITRLFNSNVSCTYTDKERHVGAHFSIADTWDLWWNTKPEQRGLWTSTVTLGERFFEEVMAHPIPIDKRALRALRGSPMALDIYVWMTHRYSYLKKPTVIPWVALQAQFGSDYARTRKFKEKFVHHLRAVHTVYGEARFGIAPKGLELQPSKPHVRKLK